MESFASMVALSTTNQLSSAVVIQRSPEELWDDLEHRTDITEILGGSIDALIMICCSPSWQADYGMWRYGRNFTSYALEQNPNTRIGLAMPWEDFPLQYDNASEHRDLTDRGYNMWKNMANRKW